MNIAGRMAKYLATSLAIEKVVIAPRVNQQLLADRDDLDQLGRVRVQVDHVGRFLAGEVPLFMASPTSAWATAGASFVPSPVMATRWPSACSARMRAILSSGLAWA